VTLCGLETIMDISRVRESPGFQITRLPDPVPVSFTP